MKLQELKFVGLISPNYFLLAVFMSGVCFLAASFLPFTRIIENWIGDFRIAVVSPWIETTSRVVIVSIDETTLAKLPYRSPLDRNFLAKIIEKIIQGNPSAIGVDVLIDQPTEAEKDHRLRSVLSSSTVPIVMAYATQLEGIANHQQTYLDEFLTGIPKGLVAIPSDKLDNTVRRYFVGRKIGDKWLPGFATALTKSQPKNPNEILIPLAYLRDANGAPFKFPTFPAHTVPLLPKSWFKDKIVLIGAALQARDRHRTPFTVLGSDDGSVIEGVALHAHAIAQIQDQRRLTTFNLFSTFGIALVLSLLGYLAIALIANLVLGAVTVLVVFGTFVAIAFVLFSQWGILIEVFPPLFSAVAVTSAFAFLMWQRDQKEKVFVRRAFSRYIDPSLVQTLLDQPERLKLGGEQRDVTYLFTDVAGFTTLTEKSDPQLLVALLNEYLDQVCALFFEHGATIDKIVGDAVVGFFGAPVAQSDHAARGIRLALAIDAYCEDFHLRQVENGIDFGITRVGIHTGTATVGNFGGDRFFDYTGHGDTVNTAARLESVNKHLGTRMCTSGETASRCNDAVFRPGGTLILKGKVEGIDVFEPIPKSAADDVWLNQYQQAFDAMKNMNPDAEQQFVDFLNVYPADPLACFHLDRLQRQERGVVIKMESK